MDDWYRTGVEPFSEGLSEKQLWFLLKNLGRAAEVLTPEERVGAELMGVERYLETLTKGEASKMIEVIKGGGVAAEVRRRSAGELRAGSRRWFDTGFRR